MALFSVMEVILFAAPAMGQVPSSSHVFLVVLENGSFNSILNPTDHAFHMPWLTSQGDAYGYAANFTSNNAGSLLAYLWLSSGTCENSSRCTSPPGDDPIGFGCGGGSCTSPITDDNIYREMNNRGMSWKLYAESIPYTGYMGSRISDIGSPYYDCCNSYDPHHNGPKWYSDIINSSTQQDKMVPFSQFATDMAAQQLPQYSIIIANDNNENHDGNGAQADAWLQDNIGPLLNQPYFQCGGDGLLIVTFDNDNADRAGLIYTAVIGPKVKAHYVSNTAYSHQNALRTILDSLGITASIGYATPGTAMTDFFGTPSGCTKKRRGQLISQ
jgi:phosphatidylinositol-3-phosphatase